MFLHWNPLSEEVKKIPHYMWPIYYRMHNFTMYHTYERLYKPQAELIASITNPEVYKSYADIKEKEQKAKKEGSPNNYTVTTANSVRSSAKADTYFDPTKGLLDYKGRVLITKEEYVKRMGDGGLIVSL